MHRTLFRLLLLLIVTILYICPLYLCTCMPHQSIHNTGIHRMIQGKLFAVKRLNMVGKPHEVEDLTREIELMKDLEHANIVGYIGASVSTCSPHAYTHTYTVLSICVYCTVPCRNVTYTFR